MLALMMFTPTAIFSGVGSWLELDVVGGSEAAVDVVVDDADVLY